jgi:hippurate hydrolase
MNDLDLDPGLVAAMTGWRRHLHTHPELSRQEKATAAYVAARLGEMGVTFTTGIGGHGVVATISKGASNRSVGLRADMDALPITETTGVAYASATPGVMHACGHDGHTTSLLGAAALLLREDDWTGTVQLVFQPAEEGYGGARAMLADGLLERFPMERIFGYHNWPGLAAGTVAVHTGPVMAAGSRINIRIQGHAGHAAMPHLTRDPMVAAAHTLVAMQTIVAREIDPMQTAVVSICTIEGGIASNQIPSEALMRGTYRTHSPEVHARVGAAIARIVQGTATMFGVTATADFPSEITATVNPREEAELAAGVAAATGLAVRRDLPPSMASEDFGAFLDQRPGAFVWIGNGPSDGGRELHNPNFDFNDAILPAAARYLANAAKRALAT